MTFDPLVPRRAVSVFALGLALGVGALAAAGCDRDDGRQLEPPTSEQRAAMPTTTVAGGAGAATSQPPATTVPFTLTLPWSDGQPIDARFTCDGEDISPALSWTEPPEGTAELALLVTDIDAADFVHWAVAGIPPGAGGMAEGSTTPEAIQGITSFGEVGWGGPCPPEGRGVHTYRFQLFALSQQTELTEGFPANELLNYTDTASLAVAEVTGIYERG